MIAGLSKSFAEARRNKQLPGSKSFILQVEGFFRSIQGAVDRTQESIVQMVEGMEGRYEWRYKGAT